MSSLFSTSQRGLRASAASYFFSSATMAARRLTGSACRRTAQVDQVQQQPRALQVAQELVAEPGAFGGAFDQARNVGDDEALLGRDADDAEIRMQRRERIVGDLRPRVRDRRDQRRLAGVRHAEQADVGEHAQLEPQRALLARPAGRLLARRAVGAGLEVQVAEAAVAALGEQCALAVVRAVRRVRRRSRRR